MQVRFSTFYAGGHDADPGYRTTVVILPVGRTYCFTSDPDGSNARSIGTRPADQPTGAFRMLARSRQVACAPKLEGVLKAWLAEQAKPVTREVVQWNGKVVTVKA